jgi:hypothetical protein
MLKTPFWLREGREKIYRESEEREGVTIEAIWTGGYKAMSD